MRRLIAVAALTCSAVAALAQSPPERPMYPGVTIPAVFEQGGGSAEVPLYVEYDKRLRASEQLGALDSELFGDSVSLYSGQTEFTQVDIDIPGNNALPVQLRRSFAITSLVPNQSFDANGGIGNPYGGLSNWDIDVPHLYGIFDSFYKWNIPNGAATTQQPRCTNYFYPRVTQPTFLATDIWSGFKVSVPGKGEKEMLRQVTDYPPLQHPTDGRPPTWTTSDFDAFRCIASPTASGEGFVMTTPDGVSYTFDVYLERSYPAVTYGSLANQRKAVFLLASKVSDRYGNEVRYTYDGLGHPTQIEGWANGVPDGRRITLAYDPANPSQLKTATAAASAPASPRTWTYSYQALAPDGIRRLTSVTLPDGVSQWTYDYTTLNTPTNTYLYVDYWAPDITGPTCAPALPAGTGGNFGLRITHPAGAKGDFRFQLQRHDRTNLPFDNCVTGPGGAWVYAVSPYVDAFRLVSKTVSTTDTTSDQWTYTYGGNVSGQPHRVRTTITLPDGSLQRHDFSSAYGATLPGAPAGVAIEGTLLETATLKSGVTLQTRTNTYFSGPDTWNVPFTGQLFPTRYGLNGASDDVSSSSFRPLKTVTTTQQGVTFTRHHLTFDGLGRPLQVERKSALAGGATLATKTETTVYKDYPALWILGLTDTVTDAALPGSPVVDNDYDTLGNVTQVTQFGRIERSTTWNADGTLATITDGPNTTTLGPFKRGIPTSVSYADGTSISAVVDDAGDIRAVTDENGSGYTTSYGYDLLRRLTSITYPTGDTVAWNTTTIAYDRVGTDATVGISGTHWRQTTATGNARKVVHYDQRLRPLVTHEYDSANPTGTQRYTRRGYDYANRETFAAYPSTSASATTGKTTSYDALGRVSGTAQDSELGVLTTATAYITPFKTQYTNARGKVTSTTYQVFDEPSESAPLVIESPLNVTTTLTRDVFGKPVTMVRSGTYAGSPISATRRYVYDANQRLCKTIEPESGATVLAYNSANLVEWKATGQTLTSTTSCQQASVNVGQKVSYTYDGRERLLATTYGDGSPNVVRTYTPDGLPATIASDNSTWTLTYNKRRLMTGESLALAAGGYPIGYTHTANGHVASMTYPDGTNVAYAPNALGEATQVGTYATQVTTYPNGALKSFQYGNGIVHTTTQNARGLPGRSVDGSVIDDTYTYDANGNVTGISDAAGTNFSRTMAYDDRDRLTTATNAGLWHGTETFTYDPLDNLRAMVSPKLTWTYDYDPVTWRLLRILNGASDLVTYGYDARGRSTARTVGTAGQTFTIDLAGRVREIVGTNPSTYRYDGNGRRTTVARGASGTITVQVYNQAGQLVYQGPPAEDRIPRVARRNYLYLGRHLIAEDGTVGRLYLHTDGLGSPVRTTSPTGVPSAREIHHPYGWGPTTNSTPGYTGHVADAETGLSYLQARYYDPYAGRFLAVDPVEADVASFNRYWYANNNPYKFVDPDGREGCAASRIGAVCARLGMSSAMAAAAREGIKQVGKEITSTVVAATVPMGGCMANGCTAGEAIYEAATSVPITKFAKYLNKAAKEGGAFFRGAKAGEAPSFVPRPSDFKVDPKTGFVKDTHGVSVFDNPSSVRSKGYVPYQVDQSSVPDSLRIIQRGSDPHHFEIVPVPGANLTPQQFISACSGIICIR